MIKKLKLCTVLAVYLQKDLRCLTSCEYGCRLRHCLLFFVVHIYLQEVTFNIVISFCEFIINQTCAQTQIIHIQPSHSIFGPGRFFLLKFQVRLIGLTSHRLDFHYIF